MSLTKQSVYDAVREHFTQPGAVFGYAFTDKLSSGQCVYEGGGGQKCAIGCQMNEVELEAFGDFQGSLATIKAVCRGDWGDAEAAKYSVEARESISRFWADLDVYTFAVSVQTLHDDNATLHETGSVEQFVGELDEMASDHGLVVRA